MHLPASRRFLSVCQRDYLNVFETKYHTSVHLGRTIKRSEPWAVEVGGGRICAFVLLFPLNMVVSLLSVEIWMSLPDIHFQKGLTPNVEFPAYAKCLEKSCSIVELTKHESSSAVLWEVLAWFCKALLAQLEKWRHYKL